MPQQQPAAVPPRTPNFVVILCDDLGYGDLGCYGSTAHDTPRLDRMAAEGTRFTNCYVPSAVCSPSRAGLLTGCYPKRTGLDSGVDFPVLLPGDPLGLSTEEVTIASLLRQQGYATKAVGKWHLGDQPEFLPDRHGFDDYFGLPYSNDMLPDLRAPGRKPYPPLMLMRRDRVVEADPNQVSLTDRYLVDALRFIHDHRDRPFFLYLAHLYVHVPIYTPIKYHHGSRNGPYGAAVAHLDFTTGLILDTLRDLGLERDTVVLFTSDNGAGVPRTPAGVDEVRLSRGGVGSNRPLRGGKGTTWEGGMREPFIAWAPGLVPAGAVCNELCSTLDLLPTLARLAGAAAPQDRIIDGADIGALLTGQPGAASPHEQFFYYGTGNHCLDAVRAGRWKLHLDKDELYDLEADVGETMNQFARHPQVVRELRARADACRDDLGDARTGIRGANCRPPGRVENPRTLLPVTEDQLWVRAVYD